MEDRRDSPTTWTRRRSVLASIGAGALTAAAGCSGGGGGDGPSPVLRLSADRGVTTDDQGRVETWADQSPNGYDMSALSAENRPTLTEDAVEGQAALTFDGENDYFLREDTLGIGNDSPRTFVVVSRLAETTPRCPFVTQGKLDASGENSNNYGIEANTWHTAGERFGVYLISVAHDSEHPTDTNYHVHTLRTESFTNLDEIRNTTTYYVDGSKSPISHTGGGVFNEQFEGDSTAIGASPNSKGNGGHVGEIAAVRVYDSALSDSERQSVESDLADTYGISLA